MDGSGERGKYESFLRGWRPGDAFRSIVAVLRMGPFGSCVRARWEDRSVGAQRRCALMESVFVSIVKNHACSLLAPDARQGSLVISLSRIKNTHFRSGAKLPQPQR